MNDFIIRNERNGFCIASGLYKYAVTAKIKLENIHNNEKILDHVFTCPVCMEDGIRECEILKVMWGVFNNPKRMY